MPDVIQRSPFTHEQELEILVTRFSVALVEKLIAAERKHHWQGEWITKLTEQECREEIARHILKGDPIDVAALCAFAWYHGWRTN